MTGTEVATLTHTIKVLIEKGDHATEKAEQFYIAAGQHLAALREGRTKKEWASIVKVKVGIGVTQAYTYMKMGRGERSLGQTRAIETSRTRRKRSKNKGRPGRPGQTNGSGGQRSTEEDVVENIDLSDEKNIVLAFMFQLTGAAIAVRNCEKILPMIAAMERPPHADDWKEMLLCAGQRANEFADLSEQLQALKHPTTRRKKSILSEGRETSQ